MNEINLKQEKLEVKSKIHLLPCKIMYNGEAKVDSYFNSTIYEMENNTNGLHFS